MIGAFLFIILISLTFFSYITNKDIFSPAKFYFLSLFLYFLNVFIGEYSFEIYLIYSFYMFLGVIIVLLELRYLKNYSLIKSKFLKIPSPSLLNPFKTISIVLALSLIPIFVQIYMIYYFGGLENYLVSMVFRVEEWQGLMAILGLKDIFPILNLFFLFIILSFKMSNKRKWVFIYILHLIIAIILGLLTGSRSWILNIFLSGLIAINYIKVSIKPIYLVLPAVFFLFGMELLNNFRSSADKVFDDSVTSSTQETNLSDQVGKSKTFVYGLNPLEQIYHKEFTDLRYGSTYLTAVTNYIPRKIWSDKPESGGTILTKFNHGYAYTGLTADSPGYIAEAIINFGYFWAYPFVLVFFVSVAFLVLSCYQFLFRNMKGIIRSFDLHTYKKMWLGLILIISSNQILGALTFAESTNVFFNLIKTIFFSIIILTAIFKVAKISVTI